LSEYDDHESERRSAPEANVQTARWSPWIWVIPVLAIFFVGYLIVRYGFFGGGDISVRFADAHGLDRYSTVRYRGAKVGTVQKITVDEESHSVLVRISMDASMNYALRSGTRFWIVEPGLEGGGVGNLLSGTYIGIAPGTGDETREFTGQEYAPVLTPAEAGKKVILEADGLGALTVGSPVQFQGMRVGRVLGSEYDARTGRTLIHAFVVERFASQIRESTRFWRAGGLSVSLSGGGLSMAGASLGSLLNSPVAFYTPELFPGGEAAEGARFQLYESQDAAVAAADGPHLNYVTYFPGPVQGLAPGTPVRIKGVEVGHVRDVRLRYVPRTASLETPVEFEIDPRKLELDLTGAASRADLRARMNEALAALVRKGMRATLATSLVLPGASGISLETVAAANSARLVVEADPPIVPAAGKGSGIEGALAAVGDGADPLRNQPIEEIAGNIRNASQRLNRLVSDPALDASLQRLNRAMADVEQITATTRRNVGPITDSIRNAAQSAETTAKTVQTNVGPLVDSLRNAAGSAEAAAARAEQLMGSSARQGYDLGALVKELTRAAEAVRALATYLEENPDALLKGRGKAK
jgi:paraquat-inducible protein B